MSKQDEMQAAIIVKKVIKKGGGHHGGAWKVAYADFVTAMMAFFLLLWLLNVSTDEALEVISSYFDPSHPKVSESTSGAGGVLGGLTMSAEGAMASMQQQPVQPQSQGQKSNEQKPDVTTLKQLEDQLRQQEEERFKKAKADLEEALQKNEALKELAKHLQIDITPEGLRIQIIDQEGAPMFASGSARMLEKTKLLMGAVADAIKLLPNNVSIRGHTDSYKYAPNATYTNWELSADRANAARRILLEKGTDISRLHDVMGKADREHLIAENPLDARNRRISILLLHETLEHALERGAFDGYDSTNSDVLPPKEKADRYQDDIPSKPLGTFQKTPGEVYFP